jgi:hypothetical protein
MFPVRAKSNGDPGYLYLVVAVGMFLNTGVVGVFRPFRISRGRTEKGVCIRVDGACEVALFRPPLSRLENDPEPKSLMDDTDQSKLPLNRLEAVLVITPVPLTMLMEKAGKKSLPPGFLYQCLEMWAAIPRRRSAPSRVAAYCLG